METFIIQIRRQLRQAQTLFTRHKCNEIFSALSGHFSTYLEKGMISKLGHLRDFFLR